MSWPGRLPGRVLGNLPRAEHCSAGFFYGRQMRPTRHDGEYSPLTFGQTRMAGIRIVTWCKRYRHTIEPNAAEVAPFLESGGGVAHNRGDADHLAGCNGAGLADRRDREPLASPWRGCRRVSGAAAEGNSPRTGNFFVRRRPVSVFCIADRDLRTVRPVSRRGEQGNRGSRTGTRPRPSRELQERIAAPLCVSNGAQYAMRLRQFSRRSRRRRRPRR
jgi:hypothetical protein